MWQCIEQEQVKGISLAERELVSRTQSKKASIVSFHKVIIHYIHAERCYSAGEINGTRARARGEALGRDAAICGSVQ